MPFDRFMELALYDPQLGYYRARRTRIGTGGQTDFFTASSSGELFGELVCAACEELLSSAGARPADFAFVELGSETREGVLKGLRHPFAGVRSILLGEPMSLTGPCIVFSNELFDAQPCRRFVRKGGHWIELGVGECDGLLGEAELPGICDEAWLPAEASEGCHFDAPRAAVALAGLIAEQPWQGLFVAFDYGRNSAEMPESCPQGTLRAYHRHRQVADLLASPGEQDLTCHVCWDWIQGALDRNGFCGMALESQEGFFVKHAGGFIARTVEAEASRPSRRKLGLLQLLQPAHMGQKFQVLRALRLA